MAIKEEIHIGCYVMTTKRPVSQADRNQFSQYEAMKEGVTCSKNRTGQPVTCVWTFTRVPDRAEDTYTQTLSLVLSTCLVEDCNRFQP
jgi:hypothetical protein